MEVKKWIEFVQMYLAMAETTIQEKNSDSLVCCQSRNQDSPTD